ncbi:fungal specific transcription factor domain containing protein [Grosmannia clavigera kw1407]|uniref:Fungal specific transcription factor domain containing protein n=1 Tax=Grosmannia clavigera (strain kw1407 / UAMH 11150) TaxID=655863 RepID=F0XIK2_GROCL|nr:fungal specific transcription factor domain containing protein [Grosmannia clavigera kw1407]EFX02461.1 fungal specific transcription factor domain containing protein [Grosmannia clavigera kw1407]
MAPSEPARERQRRRKITLACEPCRERKARCDGRKPICSTCEHRSLGLEQCIYKVGNARTACSEDYMRALHERIRRLEQACAANGVDISAIEGHGSDPSAFQPAPPSASLVRSPTEPILGLADRPPEHQTTAASATSKSTPDPESTDPPRGVSGMGTVLEEDDLDGSARPGDDFYGLSSAASFLKEAANSMRRRKQLDSPPHNLDDFTQPYQQYQQNQTLPPPAPPLLGTASSSSLLRFAPVDKFALPPRALADHFVQRYFERIFYLYPFFDRVAFEHTYRSLWSAPGEDGHGSSSSGSGSASGHATAATGATTASTNASASKPLKFDGCGLGDSDAGASSIPFHCALNAIFTLGCCFSDLPEAEKTASCEVLFNRSKAFVGLDFIDENNVGVVQSLLIIALVLQGTPFPNRCWNAVGMACRVAQGLGLHSEAGRRPRSAREKEMRLRTWHGCVIMDVLVGMTFGRPTLSSSLSIPHSTFSMYPSVGSPALETRSEQLRFLFFRESVRLSVILEGILQKIYEPWMTHDNNASGSSTTGQLHIHHSLDTIVELQDQLTGFEQSVAPYLSWVTPETPDNVSAEDLHVLEMQKNVLHARFVYMQLIMHRPILTQLVAPEGTAQHGSSESRHEHRAAAGYTPLSRDGLHYAFALECAKACVEAAKRLILLVHRTYLTDQTDAWWWNVLYTCTAGLVLIVLRLCPDLWQMLDRDEIAELWGRCQSVLQQLAYFSVSARKSMTLLLKVNENVLLKQAAMEGRGGEGEGSNDVGATANINSQQAVDPTLDRDQDAAEAQLQAHVDGMMAQLDPAGMSLDSAFSFAPLFNWDQNLDFMLAADLAGSMHAMAVCQASKSIYELFDRPFFLAQSHSTVLTADENLSSAGIRWGERWRNFGSVWGYVAFNVVVAISPYYILQVRRWSMLELSLCRKKKKQKKQ